jgi:predicted secreted protein
MGWTTAIVLFVLIWWMVLFCVLPWGVRRAGDEAQGHDAGAPLAPRLVRKAAITTGISAVLFAIAYGIIEAGWISFHR